MVVVVVVAHVRGERASKAQGVVSYQERPGKDTLLEPGVSQPWDHCDGGREGLGGSVWAGAAVGDQDSHCLRCT